MLALAIDYLSASVGFWVPLLERSATGNGDEGGHAAKRWALFITIAIGASMLVTAATFSALERTLPTVDAFVASLIGSIAMWWLYFDGRAASIGAAMASSEDPGAHARPAYARIHLLFVAGIILCAASGEFVLAHPGAAVGPRLAMMVLGGASLYLLGNLLFKCAITRRMPVSPVAGIVGLLALGACLLKTWRC